MAEVIKSKLYFLKQLVNNELDGVAPSKVIVVTTGISLASAIIYNELNGQAFWIFYWLFYYLIWKFLLLDFICGKFEKIYFQMDQQNSNN